MILSMICRLGWGCVAGGWLSVAAAAACGPEVRPLCELALEDSSYLRREAARPVAWRSWGPDVFAEAARTGRPVLLTIGYHSCWWSDWTESVVFGDAAVVARLNRDAIPVKIDRFERPDLDRAYRRAMEAQGKPASWPVMIWLSADRAPVHAMAPSASMESAATDFLREAERFIRRWQIEAGPMSEQARGELNILAQRTGAPLAGPLPWDKRMIDVALDRVLAEFDTYHGGFTSVPGFASPARLGLLARGLGRRPGRAEDLPQTQQVFERSLEAMANGGLHDWVSGGFFRYSLDPAWRHPNFEKLAHDQAQLAEAYLLGHRLYGRQEWADVARAALEYTLRDLSHPDGGFYTGEPAGNPPAMGGHYLWTTDEVRQYTGPAAPVVELVFGLSPQGNVGAGYYPGSLPAGANLLSHSRPSAEVAAQLGISIPDVDASLERGRHALRAARALRAPLSRDHLITTHTTASLVSALAQAGTQFNDPGFLDRALQAAEFIHDTLWNASTATLFRCQLDRPPAHPAVADDYAAVVRAWVDLHELTGEIKWLRRANEVQAAFDRHHAHPAGGYTDARHGTADVPVSLRSILDEASLSPNARAGLNLVRWAVLMSDPEAAESARRLVEAFAAPLAAGHGGVTGLAQVADALVHAPRRLILLGPVDHPDVRTARSRIARIPPGRWHVLSLEDASARQWLIERAALPDEAESWSLDTPSVVWEDPAGSAYVVRPIEEIDEWLASQR